MSSEVNGKKRKYTNYQQLRDGAKRFQGCFTRKEYKNTRGEFKRNEGGSRWDSRSNHQTRYSDTYRSPNYSWRKNTPNSSSFNKTNHNPDYDKLFDYDQYNPRQQSKEQNDPITGPGSEIERMEKVLATKKRIEEALASKPLHSIDQDIAFKNSVDGLNKDKNLDSNLAVTSLELRLTNSDFKEIGSVDSGVAVERENESNDMVLNITPSSSQQRSFDNSCSSSFLSMNKTQKTGGWSISSINEGITAKDSQIRVGGEKYIKDKRETILGSVEPMTREKPNQSVLAKPTNPKEADPKQARHDFSRIGQLYQSFLRSRLSGYTLKMRDTSSKHTGPNPLLDKSVLDNLNPLANSGESNNILELQISSPVQVKGEPNISENLHMSRENVAAIEGNEFCKEFGFLLKHPNFLIPSEDLEKLGLGHLCEMNRLIHDTNDKDHGSETAFESRDTLLQNRHLGTPNSFTGNDISYETPPSIMCYENVVNDGEKFINNNLINSEKHINLPTFQTTTYHPPQVGSVQAFVNQSSPLSDQNQPANEVSLLSTHQNLVENVVEKVVQKIFRSSEVKSQAANTDNFAVFTNRDNQVNSTTINQNELPPISKASSSSNIAESSLKPNINKIQEISSKVLRLFLIDKQVEDLMQEKMKIYSELLSEKEISSTLFNSWAQDQIQQGNVMKVLTNTSNTVPQLTHVLSNNIGLVPPIDSNADSFHNTVLQDSISELFSLKKEEIIEHTKADTQNHETNFVNNLNANDLFTIQSVNQSECIRPKLSVRKDLLDPEVNKELLINTENALNNTDVVTEQPIDKIIIKTEAICTDENVLKNQVPFKKKKKSKKEKIIECINLIDDSSDDEVCSVDIDVPEQIPLTERDQKVLENGNKCKKNKAKNNLSLTLENNIATCLTVLKRALIVGSKEGHLLVFNLADGKIILQSQIHTEPIVYINTSTKNVVTGSADCTISLFCLKSQTQLKTINVNSPVQCCDIKFSRLFVGTKTGTLATYKLETSLEESGNEVLTSLRLAQQPLKLTESSILDVKAAKEGARIVLIIASRGEQVTVRDASSGLLLRAFDWCDTVYCLQLFEQLPVVYCGTNTKSVKVVNYMNGENTSDCFVGRSVIQMLFRNSVLFAACHDGKIYAYDVKMKIVITVMSVSKGLILSIAVVKKKLIVANNRGQLQVISFPLELKEHLKKNCSNRKK